MEVTQCVMGDFVERQSASRPIKKHSDSAAACTGKTFAPHFTIMPSIELLLVHTKIPGFGIRTERCLVTIPLPYNALVRNTYTDLITRTSTPLYFPVMAPSQPLPAQNLSLCIKPLRTIRIRLPCSIRCLLVVLRQNQVVVCSVWVQGEITGV